MSFVGPCSYLVYILLEYFIFLLFPLQYIITRRTYLWIFYLWIFYLAINRDVKAIVSHCRVVYQW